MEELPNPLPIPAITPADIYAAKQARRIRLARLPIDQKVDLIEQLHELALTMVSARKTLPKPVAGLEAMVPTGSLTSK